MDRYQLAKIIGWAGTLRSRKRMQKLIFLLKAAGCPLDADYELHNYGPYPFDVARLTDELTREGLLKEEAEGHPPGERYNYSLPHQTKQQMTEYEESIRGSENARCMDEFAALARIMCETELEELEISSIIVYFRQRGHDWAEAIARTCTFRDLTAQSALLGRAADLAKRVLCFAQRSVSEGSTTSHCQPGLV